MRFASFLPGTSLTEWAMWARRFEDAGFDSLWQGEIVNSAMVPLAAVAPATSRIKLGTGVSLAFAHSPVMLALAAMDMDVLTEGRFCLGLGVAHPNRNNNWYAGRDIGKPVSQMREYIEAAQLIMDRAQAGGEVTYDGRFYQLRARRFFARSVKQPRPRVPIYIAGVKKKMVALAAEIADGLIGNPLFSPKHLRDVVVPAVREGIMRSGRHRQTFEILGQCFTVIEDDLSTAYRIGAGAMLFSIWARIYDPIFEAHGFGEVVARVRDAQRGKTDPLDLIRREMVDAFCAVGPIDRVRARLREREAYLETAILAVPATGTTSDQQTHYRDKIVEHFAE